MYRLRQCVFTVHSETEPSIFGAEATCGKEKKKQATEKVVHITQSLARSRWLHRYFGEEGRERERGERKSETRKLSKLAAAGFQPM